MTNDRAQNTRKITARKTDTRLRQATITLLGTTQPSIDHIDHFLKRRELGHGIRNLSCPERIQSLIQPAKPVLSNGFAPSFAQSRCVGWQGGLHTDFDSLQRAQSHIREEFGAGAGAEVDECAVRVGEELFAVPVLEHFVETVFTSSLEGVANKCGRPAEEDAADTFFCEDGAPGGDVGFVDVGVDLAAAFDEVEGCDGCVSWAFLCQLV